ncbi:hypothetical protein MNBD_BACTEROID07-1579 [hydrothermal vent metagenome]|uniref:Uncharacterized protein n=1 Tax=hydrothermal vent metagenome TaxID=652676 RepID=A0A3B0VEM9_9ZZZZ
MLYTPETYQIEKDLVHWCKTGEPVAIPGTRQKGLDQYRRLIRNNIHNAMEQAFPIAYTVLKETQWNTLIDDFHANHPAATPQVWKLPEEFYTFAEANHYDEKFSLPFLNDLLHFEWIEIAVHTMADKTTDAFSKDGNPLTDKIVVHPEYRMIQLNYPVHLYAAEEALSHKGDYFLLTFRTRDFDVRFVDLPMLHAYCFEQILSGKTVAGFLKEIEHSSGQLLNTAELKRNILEFVQTMFSQGVFCGYSND